MIQNAFIAFFISIIVAVTWLRLIDYLAAKGFVASEISRKMIHIGTGPIFVLCWLLFPDKTISRYLAAIIPLLITGQFFLVGMGIIKDEEAVKAMSRSGDRREILKGPLIYGLVFIFMSIVFWRENAIGIIALLILCGGDGMADLVGTKIGKHKIPWSPKKSWQGSIAMFSGAAILIMLVFWIYFVAGFTELITIDHWLALCAIIGIATIVETLPTGDLDNLFVPLASVLFTYLFL